MARSYNRQRRKGGYVIDFKVGQGFGEPQPLFCLASFVFLLAACQRNPVTAPKSSPSGVAVFTANRFTIHRGESAVLSWSCINAKSVSISDIGVVVASGAYPVHPVATTTYVLTAQFTAGSATRAVTISVL